MSREKAIDYGKSELCVLGLIVCIVAWLGAHGAAGRAGDFPTWCPSWALLNQCECTNGTFEFENQTWCLPECDDVGYFDEGGQEVYRDFEGAFRIANCIGEPCPDQGVTDPATEMWWPDLLEHARSLWISECCDEGETVGGEPVRLPKESSGVWSCDDFRDYYARAKECNGGDDLTCDQFRYLVRGYFAQGQKDCAWLLDVQGFVACMQSHFESMYGQCVDEQFLISLRQMHCADDEDQDEGRDPREENEEREDYEQPDYEVFNPCGGIISSAPILLDKGWKLAPNVDATVAVPGPDLVIERMVASNPVYMGAGLVGENQTLSPFVFVKEQWYDSQQEQNGCISMRWRVVVHDLVSGRRFDASERSEWCNQQGSPLPPDGPGVKYINDGPSTDFIVPGTATVNGQVFAVWKLIEPGVGEKYFYRKWHEGLDVPGAAETPEGLHGLLALETDPYGNRKEFVYRLFGPEGSKQPRCTEIQLFASGESLPAARVNFFWHFRLGEGNAGRLSHLEVWRPISDLYEEMTDRVQYVYKTEGDGLPDSVGTDGDLVAVINEQAVDAVEGAQIGDPLVRTWITLYRYHNTDENEDATDDDGDGYLEKGGNHQLKAIIAPEAFEYFAEHGQYTLIDANRYRSAMWALLNAGDGTPLALDSGGSITPYELASKLMPEYETTGQRRLLRQLVAGACGCSGGSESGWREMRYEYIEFSGTAPFQTTKIEEYGPDEQGSFAVLRHTTYHDLIRPEGPVGAPYLMTQAIVEPGPGGRQWVTHYEYDPDTRVKLREYTPSACASYTPAQPPQGGQGAVPPQYSAAGDTGVVRSYVYNDLNLMTEVYDESGGVSAILSRTTYGDSNDEILKYLPIKVEQFRSDVPTTLDEEIETAEFNYGFHEAGTFKIAWVENAIEAELGGENGPGGTYTSVLLRDDKGRAHWERAEDGVLINREFDDKTGGVTKLVRNADPVDLAGHPYSSAGANVPGWGRDGLGQRLPGGELSTEYEYDVLGRVIRQTNSNGVSGYLVRDMAFLDPMHGRDTLRYYRTMSLPHQWADGGAREPAIVRHYTAGATLLEESTAEVQSNWYADDPIGTLLSGVPLSRATYVASYHGAVHATRVWNDVAGNDFAETKYGYDAFGRKVMEIAPTGDVTKWTYDSLDRTVEILSGIVDQNGEPDESTFRTLVEFYFDGDGTASHGVGNGLVTLKREFISDSEWRDTRKVFDRRERLWKVINPLPPHTLHEYDNLGRVVATAQFAVAPPDDIDDSNALADRLTLNRTVFGQRGLAYKTQSALNPTSAASNVLETYMWYDEVGRVIASTGPDAPTTKSIYDAHGRETSRYVSDRGGDAAPGTTQSHADAQSLNGDVVLKEVHSTYGATGYLDLVTVHRRSDHVPDTATGPLSELSESDAFVASFVGYVYDEIGRGIRTVNFGTNLNVFGAGGNMSITWPPTSVPDWDSPGYEDAIVTGVEFNDHGEAEFEIDPLGRRTRTVRDDRGRTIAVIENFEDAIVTWYGNEDRWKLENLDDERPDVDRGTSFVYDDAGRLKRQVAHVPSTSASIDAAQITEFVYGVSPSTGSDLYSNSLVYQTRYPQESGPEAGLPGTSSEFTVTNAYNRAGEQVSITDQNGTMHALTLDAAGRVVRDEVTSFGPNIDDEIAAIRYGYDALGRRVLVESLDDLEAVRNAVEFDYDVSGALSAIWQDVNSAVDRSGGASDSRKVEYTYLIEAHDEGNRLRRTGMNYPSGASLVFEYGSGGSVHDAVGRASGLSIVDEPAHGLVEYRYVGTNMPVAVDYPGPDVRIDRALSHNGTRTDGQYESLDRFGRITKHMWVGWSFGANDPATAHPAAPSLVEIDYTYDRAGNRVSRFDGRAGAKRNNRDEEFAYDELNRLLEANRGVRVDGSTFSFAPTSESWVLDALGNWAGYNTDADTSGVYTHTEAREHNFANEVVGQDFDDDGTDEAFLTYDKVGNLRTRSVGGVLTTYIHDAWNRLVRVRIGADTYGEYEYNGLHQRTVRRAIEDTPLGIPSFDRQRYFVYDADWRIVEEHHDDDFAGGVDAWTEYFWGLRGADDIVRRRLNLDLTDDGSGITYDASYYHLTDPSLSTVAIIGDAGSIVERVQYDAYGRARHRWWNDVDGDGDYDQSDRQIILNLSASLNGAAIGDANYNVDADLNQDGVIDYSDVSLATTNYRAALPRGLMSSTEVDNQIGYAGYLYAPETDLSLARHRWYSAILGRWLERDPAGYVDGMNLYLYVAANPIWLVDPLGLSWWKNFKEGVVTFFAGNDDLREWQDSVESSMQNQQERIAARQQDSSLSKCERDHLLNAEQSLEQNRLLNDEVSKQIADVNQARADAVAAAAALIPGFGTAIAAAIEAVNAGVDVSQGDLLDAGLRIGGAIGAHGLNKVIGKLKHQLASSDELGEALSNSTPPRRLARDRNVNPRPPRPLPADRPIGRSAAQNAELSRDVAAIKQMNARDIRVNQHQVNAAGVRVGINKPDLQYTVNGRRFYIEYDRAGNGRAMPHYNRIRANDPDAGGILLRTID